MKIKRWGTYLVDLKPMIGTKPGKVRPAVVIQSDILNEAQHPSTLILPISSNSKNKDQFPLRVFLPKNTAGLEKDSVVLVDQILAWDNRRFIKQLGQVSETKALELKNAVKEFLDF